MGGLRSLHKILFIYITIIVLTVDLTKVASESELKSSKGNLNVTSNSSTSNTTTSTVSTTTISTTTKEASKDDSKKTKAECNCINGGKCDPSTQECKCPNDFYGTICEYKKCNDTMAKFIKCANTGLCLQDTLVNDKFKCLCEPSHTGVLCEKPVCLGYCYNNGKCNDGLDKWQFNGFEDLPVANLSCSCSTRYFGDRCEFDKCSLKIDSCAADCYLDDDCSCKCNKECDELYCRNQGKCVAEEGNLKCSCKLGFSGPTCFVNECSGYCFNGGTCIPSNTSLSCQCPDGFNGTRCSVKAKIHPTPTPPSASRSSMKGIIYAFAVTLSICLLAIGAYYTIQKGYLDNTPCFKYFSHSGSDSSNARNLPFIRTNFSFNKLEDEQGITQNEMYA